ncbi:MAG: multidrug transporter subunit MdtD [Proteobacteria bacterium]|jgi:EmrB/QacA subfamily drug resistance transporter|nr:multidrug transporter subunit MdtD [Pseudomonadota bacterium]
MTETPTSDLNSPNRTLLWLVALGFFMQMLDATIVNTALPTMAASLGEHPLRMHMVIIAYTLSVALFMPASGWLADRFGTRRVFTAAVVLFTFGSLLCAQAQTLTQLVLARIVQGMGGAMLMPVGRLAVLRAFPREKFLQAMSFVTIPGLIGPLVGPSLGGLLVEIASWHWIFLINLPVGLIAGLLGMRLMPDFRASSLSPFDLSGYALLAFCMVVITVALDGISNLGLQRTEIVALFVSGLIALAAYWLRAARWESAPHPASSAPLFPLSLFHTPSFCVGIFGNFFARIGNASMPFLLPLMLQIRLDYPPFKAGLMMVPAALAGISAKGLVSALVSRFGYRRVLAANTFLVGFMICAFSLISPATPFWWLITQLFVFGAINSLQFSVMNSITLKDLQPQQASSGSSLLSMVMQLSMSLGISTAGALLAAFSAISGSDNNRAFTITFICMGVITLASTWIFLQLKKDGHGSVRL